MGKVMSEERRKSGICERWAEARHGLAFPGRYRLLPTKSRYVDMF